MRQIYPTERLRNRGNTVHKILSITAVAFLLLGTTFAFAQTEFEGSLDSVSITDSAGTNNPPIANFTYTQDGDTFTFDASGSTNSDGSITQYQWDFGDETSSVGVTTSHHFETAKPYPVTLTIVDNNGGIAISQSNISNGNLILAEQSSNYSYTISTALFASDARVVGQSFKVTKNGTANNIVLYTTDNSSANITIKIGTTTDLSSSYLGKGTLAYDGSAPGEITVNLDAGVTLKAGVTYYLAVYADGAYANRISLLGSSSYSYESGSYLAANGWPLLAQNSRFDLYFKVTE